MTLKAGEVPAKKPGISKAIRFMQASIAKDRAEKQLQAASEGRFTPEEQEWRDRLSATTNRAELRGETVDEGVEEFKKILEGQIKREAKAQAEYQAGQTGGGYDFSGMTDEEKEFGAGWREAEIAPGTKSVHEQKKTQVPDQIQELVEKYGRKAKKELYKAIDADAGLFKNDLETLRAYHAQLSTDTNNKLHKRDVQSLSKLIDAMEIAYSPTAQLQKEELERDKAN